MIEVEHLTKSFGDVVAINDLSFEVEKGQILGFLGPNGAGKTTTMRILAGFFPATEGRACVAGFDVFDESLEAKKRVGYMPEIPPLYPEMSVDAFLKFAATIKAVETDRIQAKVDYVKERCGLDDWGHRLIKHLSKGYRQRVGLAQALVHDPPVLILDEPTVGLDPNQIIEVRKLIKGLADDHTVILSTHILPEVSMTCQKVVIIKQGEIAAVDTPENLTVQLRGNDQIDLQIKTPGDPALVESVVEELRTLPQVGLVETSPGNGGLTDLLVESGSSQDIRPAIARMVIDQGLDLLSLQRRTMTLEQVFRELTTEEDHVEPKPGSRRPWQWSGTRGGVGMRNFWAIVKKDLLTLFTSPIAYVVLAVFFAVTGYFFFIITTSIIERVMQSMFQAQQFGGPPRRLMWPP